MFPLFHFTWTSDPEKGTAGSRLYTKFQLKFLKRYVRSRLPGMGVDGIRISSLYIRMVYTSFVKNRAISAFTQTVLPTYVKLNILNGKDESTEERKFPLTIMEMN